MNINTQGGGFFLSGSRPALLNSGFGLKSTRQKLERQAECSGQIEFFEQQKKSLKDMKCESLADIERKLQMFHSYEDQIAAAKMAYNSEQMWHVMDEAQELAEKIAEQAKEAEPKTPEERKEELAKEALGIDEGEGLLSEVIEELPDAAELTEEDIENGLCEMAENAQQEELSAIAEELENGNTTEQEKTIAGIDIRI